MLNKVKTFFRNLKLWYPILVDDQQWDDHYLHKVVHHKLSLMKDFYESDKPMAVEEHSQEVVKEINEVLEPLNRVIEEDYIHFPEGMEPKMISHKKEDGSGFYNLEIVYHDEFGKEKVNEVYRKSERDKEEDLKKAYKNIGDNSENWWD